MLTFWLFEICNPEHYRFRITNPKEPQRVMKVYELFRLDNIEEIKRKKNIPGSASDHIQFLCRFPLPKRDQKIYWVLQHVYEQQKYMYDECTHSVKDRIVNIYIFISIFGSEKISKPELTVNKIKPENIIKLAIVFAGK